MILDFPIRRESTDSQSTGTAQAKPREGVAGRTPRRDVECQRFWSRCGSQVSAMEDLLAEVVPISVQIEVDPGIQLVADRIRILQIDQHRRGRECSRRGVQRSHERDAVFVIHAAVVIITAGRVIRLAIQFRISPRAKPRSHCGMPRSVVGKRRGIA